MKEINLDDPLRPTFLFHGYSGSGKTWLVGHFPKLVYGDTERGFTTLWDLKRVKGIAPVKTLTLHTREDLFKYLELAQSAPPGAVENVALDSFTDAQAIITLQVLDEYQKIYRRARRITDQLEQQDWGRILIPEVRFMRVIQDFAYGFVCVAQTSAAVDPMDRPRVRAMQREAKQKGQSIDPVIIPLKYFPAIRGQFKDVMPHCFDVVGFMHTIPGSRGKRLWFRETEIFFAKTRFSQMPDYIDLPDHNVNPYALIMAAIDGKLPQVGRPAGWIDDAVEGIKEDQANETLKETAQGAAPASSDPW